MIEINHTFLFSNVTNDSLQSEVFAVAFAVLAAGAIILTLNVLLLVRFSSGAPLLFLELNLRLLRT